jgi:hypothetical protein
MFHQNLNHTFSHLLNVQVTDLDLLLKPFLIEKKNFVLSTVERIEMIG